MILDKENLNTFKNNLTILEIEKILEKFNGNPILKNDNIIISRTICHNGDSHKLYYYNNTKLFKCYTGCGEDSFDIYELIEKIYKLNDKQISLEQIIDLICSILGKNIITNTNSFNLQLNKENLIDKQKEILSIQNQHSEEYHYNIYSSDILKFLDRVYVEEWEQEGINKKTHYKYGIRFYPITGQIIIPHYDINNNLIGIRGRFLRDEDCELYGKYKPVFINNILYSHPLSFSLYGINFNHRNISKSKKAIIFEGEKSVLLMDSLFGEQNNISVACCGSSVSKQQINLLLHLGVTEIIIALDRQYKELNDEEHNKYIMNILKISEKIYNYCTVSVIYDKEYKLNYKDSPIDRGKDIFLSLFQNRIIINDDIINFYRKDSK